MDRKEQLLNIVGDDELLKPMVEQVMFMESQLDYYITLPMIKVNPDNPEQQKSTPASKLYKEMLQQYTNVIKVLARCTDSDDNGEESPLRKWAKKYVNTE